MSAYLDKKVIVRWRHVMIKNCVFSNQYSSIIYISRGPLNFHQVI